MSRETKASQASSDLRNDLRRGSRPNAAGNQSTWRGRGRGHGVNSWRQPARTPQAQEQPLGNLVTSIDIPDLSRVETQPKIEDCEYVASYNWVDDKVPTILVPGL